MEVVDVPIVDLNPNEYNPRRMNEKESGDIQKSIDKFGMVVPIVVNSAPNRKNIIIGGHQRYYLLKEQGKQTVPVVYQDIPDINNEKELNLRLNENTAHWDYDLLANLDEALLRDVGFSEKELLQIYDIGLGSEKGEDERKFTTDEIVEAALKDARNHGFPYRIMGDAEMLQEFNKLVDYDGEGLIEISSIGALLEYEFQPEMFHCKVPNATPPFDVWEKGGRAFKELLKFLLKHEQKLSIRTMRLRLRIASGAQGVSGFRPTIAKTVYTNFAEEGARILDPSSGWGGRLLGFLARGKGGEYIGVDPSAKAIEGVKNMNAFFNKDNIPVKFLQIPFEEFPVKDYQEYFDLVFTSPPYFAKEMYTDEATQSWVRYPEYVGWRDGFLKPFFENAYVVTRKGGKVLVNIANVKIKQQDYPLEEDAVRLGKEAGFKLTETRAISFGSRRVVFEPDAVDANKTEPLFVFEKV